MNLDRLPTPALVLDRGIVARNTATLTERIRGLGVDLRPHMKTAKSLASGSRGRVNGEWHHARRDINGIP